PRPPVGRARSDRSCCRSARAPPRPDTGTPGRRPPARATGRNPPRERGKSPRRATVVLREALSHPSLDSGGPSAARAGGALRTNARAAPAGRPSLHGPRVKALALGLRAELPDRAALPDLEMVDQRHRVS